MLWLWIFAGGGAGALLRYELGGWVQAHAGTGFPWGTLAVNATGCFAIGLVATAIDERGLAGPGLRAFLVAGVLGGYTTFSSFGLETWRLLEEASWAGALANAAGSVAACLVAVAAGVVVGRLA